MLNCFWREKRTLSSPESLVTQHQKTAVSDMGTVLEQVVRNVK